VSEAIAAIDIGTSKCVTVIADVDTRLVTRVVAVGSVPCVGLRRGTVVDIEDVAASVVSSVRRAEQMANRKIGRVVISVTGEHMVGRNSQGIVPIVPAGRTITREDVNRVINHSKTISLPNDAELIQAIPRNFKIDGQDGVHRPIGMSGERLEVSTHLISGQVSHIQNLERCIHRAQIEIESVVHSPLASGVATATKDEMQSGVVVVDIGGGTTDVAIFTDGSIESTAVVPIGSSHVTADVSKLLKTPLDEAERLKIQSGACDPEAIDSKEVANVVQAGHYEPRPMSRRVLAEIVRARMREILTMALGDAIHAGTIERLGGGIVLTGGGARITGIQSLAESIAPGVPARVGSPVTLGGLSDMISGPEHSTAVGLVKYGLKMREDESVTAESRDWREMFSGIAGIFGGKAKAKS
jgi:cell division protein FtsA